MGRPTRRGWCWPTGMSPRACTRCSATAPRAPPRSSTGWWRTTPTGSSGQRWPRSCRSPRPTCCRTRCRCARASRSTTGRRSTRRTWWAPTPRCSTRRTRPHSAPTTSRWPASRQWTHRPSASGSPSPTPRSRTGLRSASSPPRRSRRPTRWSRRRSPRNRSAPGPTGSSSGAAARRCGWRQTLSTSAVRPPCGRSTWCSPSTTTRARSGCGPASSTAPCSRPPSRRPSRAPATPCTTTRRRTIGPSPCRPRIPSPGTRRSGSPSTTPSTARA